MTFLINAIYFVTGELLMQNRVHTVHCKHIDISSISSGSCSCLAASWTLKHPALYKQTIQNKLLAILNILHFPINNQSHKGNRNELEWTTLNSYCQCLNFMSWALRMWIKASSIWMVHHIVERDAGFSFNVFPLRLSHVTGAEFEVNYSSSLELEPFTSCKQQ